VVARVYEQHGAVGKARFIILTKAIIKLLAAPYSEDEQNALVKKIFGEQGIFLLPLLIKAAQVKFVSFKNGSKNREQKYFIV
jgi:hypothetical protein